MMPARSIKRFDSWGILSLTALFFAFDAWLPVAVGQAPTHETLDRSVAYGTSFLSLNQDFAKNREHYTQLSERLDSIAQRFKETNQDGQAIQNLTIQNNLEATYRYVRETDLTRSLGSFWRPNMTSNLRDASAVSRELSNSQLASFHLQLQNAQLDVAQRATMERWYKLLMQYQESMRQVNSCFVEEKRLADAYVALSDQSATRCRIELSAALRALDATAEDNFGARIAKAITSMRQRNLEAAADQFTSLNQLPLPYSAIVTAARLEMSASPSGPKATREELRILNSVSDPTVIFFRARTAAIQGSFSDTLKLTERLLKVESYQIQALILSSLVCSHPDNNEAKPAKALEHALLASDLTGGRDWYATIALALAYAANKDSAQALSTANKAIDLSIADMREKCREIHTALSSSQPARWKF